MSCERKINFMYYVYVMILFFLYFKKNKKKLDDLLLVKRMNLDREKKLSKQFTKDI